MCHCKFDELQCGYVVLNASANYYQMRKLWKTLTSILKTQKVSKVYHVIYNEGFLKKENLPRVYQVKQTFMQFSKNANINM